MSLALSHYSEVVIELASVPVIFVVLVAVGRLLKRRHGVRLGMIYLLFCASISILLPLKFLVSTGHIAMAEPAAVSTGQTQDGTRLKAVEERLSNVEQELESQTKKLMRGKKVRRDYTPLESAMRLLGAVATLLGALVIIALVRRFFWEMWFEQKSKSQAPKFLSQLVGLAIFLGAILIVLTVGYEQDLTVLLGASGVAAIVLGLALQDLLGNVIAGIALELGKPFRAGDWLVIDGAHAEVIEVNWRSTRLRNNDDIYFDIPNKQIVGSTIVNLTHPNRRHGIRLQVRFEYGTPPNLVKDTLTRAATNAKGVLEIPPPKVFLKDFGDFGIDYEIRFWMEDESKYNDTLDGVRTNIWYEAQRGGLTIPFPIREINVRRKKTDLGDKLEIARTSIRRQPFLQMLSPSQLDRMLNESRFLRFGRGERIIEQGAEGKSMFILVHGEAEVQVEVNGVAKIVAQLEEGDYCGEMSLLTGENRSATVIATTDCETWEVGNEVLASILADNQLLVERLSELLARRRMETEGVVAEAAATDEMKARQKEYKESFLKRLYGFFDL